MPQIDGSPMLDAQTGISAIQSVNERKLDQGMVDEFFAAKRAFDAASGVLLQATVSYRGLLSQQQMLQQTIGQAAGTITRPTQLAALREAASTAGANLLREYDVVCDSIARLHASL